MVGVNRKFASALRISESQQVQWLISLDLALIQLLLVILVSLEVLARNKKSASFSKLTFLPFYFLFGYGLCSIVQYSITFSTGVVRDFIAVVFALRSDFLYTAIGFQTFEWFSAWWMIRSQQHLDVTTVSVQRHKEQRCEIVVRNVFVAIVGLYFTASFGCIAYGFYLNRTREPSTVPGACSDYMWQFRFVFDTYAIFTNVAAFVVTVLMFSHAAYKRHRSEWNDYRTVLFIQALGISTVLGNCVFINCEQRRNLGLRCSPLLSPSYLTMNCLEIVGCFVFVLTKRFHDIFKCFNKRPDV